MSTEYDEQQALDEREIEAAYAQWQHDQRRGASPMDHSGEIPMLERALAGPMSAYSAAGWRCMQARLAILKAEAGLLPVMMGE